MDKPLAGRTALITGASKGLGKAMALALGAAGARLVLVSRDLPQLEQTAAAARERGAEAHVFRADVSREDEVRELEKQVTAAGHRVNILINNAGINVRKQVTEFTLDEWRSVMDTNLTAVFLLCRSFVPRMKGQGYGRILNMTSIMSHVSIPGRTAYSASKSGLLGFTRALALELASENITVVGISPGPFATEMNTALMQNPELNQQFISRIPLGRWGRVEEIGQLAVYLCSEEAGFLTGTDILIDGGWCAQ
ncbi:MAG: glucose 1-dehydrogenase [Acidobacteria bacterium]|nr:glucose 1-dehydrogenase [Acidobacteriota bacterium]MBI3279517.1 glucose 1-dehydrogenase [Acidobacteriota bacterium]